MNKYIVMTARCKMPNNCKGGLNYYRVAVVETDGINMPKQIHPYHRNVKQIVWIRNKLYRGTTDKCAFAIAKKEAEELCERLNLQENKVYQQALNNCRTLWI